MAASLSTRSRTTSGQPTRQQLDELDALLKRMLELPVNQTDEEPTPVRASARQPAPPPPEPEEEDVPLPDFASLTETPAEEAPLAPRVVRRVEREKQEPQAPEPEPSAPADRIAPRALAAPATAEPEGEESWVPLRANWRPSSQTWGPLAESWQRARQEKEEDDAPPARLEEPAAPRPTAEVAKPAPRPRPVPPPPEVEPEPESDHDYAELPASAAAYMSRGQAPAKEATADPGPPLPLWCWPLLLLNGAFDLLLLPFGAPGRWLRSGAGRNVLAAVGFLCLGAAALLGAVDWFGWTW